MDTQKLSKSNVLYDEAADVLYISFGKPRPGIATEVNEGDLVRTDLKTREVVGITIVGFEERYMLSKTDIVESAKILIPKLLKEFKEQAAL